jgi:EAL domain-containing protein (putative c-di-GMP-specific phosphodiesterase class I)
MSTTSNDDRPARVLVIDDDTFMLDVVESLLLDEGVREVGLASDGAAGLEAIDRQHRAGEPWDLVMCDLNMPGMDGIQLARHLAERGFRGAVVLMSGVEARLAATVGHLVRRHRLRFVAALKKPLDPDELRRALRDACSIRARVTGAPPLTLTPDEIRSGMATCVEVFFQPKVSMATRKVTGAECLARFRDPVRGLVPPVAFIPVCEEHGMIGDLTAQVFRRAVEHLGLFRARGHRLGLSVNVSMEELTHIDIPDKFGDLVAHAGIDAGQLTLELTESRVMRDVGAALEILTRLRLKGFGLSVDDFGTGYSNLATLKLLPFNELKVDRAFVFGAGKDPVARAILESSARLARALTMEVVAEGAETSADLDVLAEVGCDVVQGYVIAKPMPAAEFLPWKERWEAGS